MFTFALAFFAGHRYFSLHFQPLSAFRWKRKKEFGRKHLQRKPLTTTTTCVRHRVLKLIAFLACSILFIFSERKYISKSWRKLMNYKAENRIPWLFTDLDNIKDFRRLFNKSPDFSLTLKTFRFSLTFPWQWQPWFLFERGDGCTRANLGRSLRNNWTFKFFLKLTSW